MLTIVLVTSGKLEDVHEARVLLFNSEEAASAFVRDVHEPDEKYWTRAQIVLEGTPVCLEGKENAH